jgi:hypothetical protein
MPHEIFKNTFIIPVTPHSILPEFNFTWTKIRDPTGTEADGDDAKDAA